VARVSHPIDRIRVSFDDPNLVANAGLLLVGTLVVRLEVERVVNTMVRLGGRVGGALPGRKVLTLVHAMVAGGSHIDHADVLRAGNTAGVLPHRVMAPSTLGTFLRSFSFGHVRQLEAVVGEVLRRAWALGAGPGVARLVIDVDSTICEVSGKAKSGAAYGYTKVLGYHPILATRADTGEILHARMRKGSANTARGARRFIEELVARVRRSGAAGDIVVRVDSGFWSKDTIATLGRLDVRYTMAVRTATKGIAAVIAAIDESAWVDIDYTAEGQAQVAETVYKGRRLIVRRTRLTDRHQARLWPEWRHFAFLTDLDGDAAGCGRLPSPARRDRTRHPRPQRRCRPRPRALGQLLGQRGVAVLRRGGPQPHPLDGHHRPGRHRGPAECGSHRAPAAHQHPGPAGQPRRGCGPAGTARVAVAPLVPTAPGCSTPPRTALRLSALPRRARRTRTPRVDNLDNHEPLGPRALAHAKHSSTPPASPQAPHRP
jgi:hypothetical protein